MQWTSRTLPGHGQYRPSLVWNEDPEKNLSVAIAPWGSEVDVKKWSDFCVAALGGAAGATNSPTEPSEAASSDPDATQVRALAAPKRQLQETPGDLSRVLTKLNSVILAAENRSQWSRCAEVALVERKGNQLRWALAGEFSLLVQTDSGFQILAHQKTLRPRPDSAPLPILAVGLDSYCSVVSGQAHVEPHQKLILLYSNVVPVELFAAQDLTLEQVIDLVSAAGPDLPHAIAISD